MNPSTLFVAVFVVALSLCVVSLIRCRRRFKRLEQAYDYAVYEHDFNEWQKSRG